MITANAVATRANLSKSVNEVASAALSKRSRVQHRNSSPFQWILDLKGRVDGARRGLQRVQARAYLHILPICWFLDGLPTYAPLSVEVGILSKDFRGSWFVVVVVFFLYQQYYSTALSYMCSK